MKKQVIFQVFHLEVCIISKKGSKEKVELSIEDADVILQSVLRMCQFKPSSFEAAQKRVRQQEEQQTHEKRRSNMFELYEVQNKNKFTWKSIGDVVEGRANLGNEMPVFAYRLFQYSLKDELVSRLGGKETIDIFRAAGAVAGKAFAENVLKLDLPFNDFMVHLQNVLEEFKMGILRIEKFDIDTGKAVLTIGEDLDCSGLPVTGETVCNYDEGFLAGILNAYTKQEYVVTEVDCWATGSSICRFEARVVNSEMG